MTELHRRLPRCSALGVLGMATWPGLPDPVELYVPSFGLRSRAASLDVPAVLPFGVRHVGLSLPVSLFIYNSTPFKMDAIRLAKGVAYM